MTGSVSVVPPYSATPGQVVRETYGRYMGDWQPSYLATGYMTTRATRQIATTLAAKYNQGSVLIFTALAGADNLFHVRYPNDHGAEEAMWRLPDYDIDGACYDPKYRVLFVPAYSTETVTYDTVARFARATGGDLTKTVKGKLSFVDQCDFGVPVPEADRVRHTVTIWIGGVRNWTRVAR